MEYNIYITAKTDIIEKLNSLFDRYQRQGVDLNSLKKWITKKGNFNNILKDIRNEGSHYFDSITEYENFVKDMIYEVLNDRIAVEKDNLFNMNENNNHNARCPKCGFSVNTNEQMGGIGAMVPCPSCGTPIIGKIMESVKDFGQYTQKITALNEMNIPVLKLDDLMDSVPQTRSSHKYVISGRYKIPQDYIDTVSAKKHHFKVNDMRGDVMGNARVVFDVYVFDKNDIMHINDNIIDYCVDDFINQLPETLNIFGINIAPMSFVDKKELKKTFEMTITFEETLRIITQVTNFSFDMKIDDFYIWSNKHDIGQKQPQQ